MAHRKWFDMTGRWFPEEILHKDRPYRRYYEPWFDDTADYNTNALSYYDYLAKFNQFGKASEAFINRLMDRTIEVEDTNTIDMSLQGDWLDNGSCTKFGAGYDDTLTIKGDVKVSKAPKNAIKKHHDGLHVYDFADDIAQIKNDVKDIKGDINSIKSQLSTLGSSLNSKISQLEKLLKQLQGQLDNLPENDGSGESALAGLQKIIDNLYQGGHISSKDPKTFKFNRNIAAGNINLFGTTPDGKYFIRTNQGQSESDITAGIS